MLETRPLRGNIQRVETTEILLNTWASLLLRLHRRIRSTYLSLCVLVGLEWPIEPVLYPLASMKDAQSDEDVIFRDPSDPSSVSAPVLPHSLSYPQHSSPSSAMKPSAQSFFTPVRLDTYTPSLRFDSLTIVHSFRVS